VTSLLVEACAVSAGEALGAQRAGAGRIELCRSLDTGGLTPSAGLLEKVKSLVGIPVHAMLRPFPGPFTVESGVLAAMLRDVKALASAGADGLVLGVLDHRGGIHARALRILMEAAGSLPVVFHRAFDRVQAPGGALETLMKAGVAGVLTSGGPTTAWEGRQAIRSLVESSEGRIQIMAGGGVREDHVAGLIEVTGVGAVHARVSAVPGIVRALKGSRPGRQ
jgi:copper homeostasis protein